MKIDRVTFSGVDSSVSASDVVRVADKYRSIRTEWALLLSASNAGRLPRYPSMKWVSSFVTATQDELILAGHFQGRWLREMYGDGESEFLTKYKAIWNSFARMQLNFRGHKLPTDGSVVKKLSKLYLTWANISKQVIIQMDGTNDQVYHDLAALKRDVVPLFDKSGGSGILSAWPEPIGTNLVGYAGGLGPHNITEQLGCIAAVAGNHHVWIDMETHIRSDDGRVFDLDKCEVVLKAMEAWRKS